jgi:hypothetical protein
MISEFLTGEYNRGTVLILLHKIIKSSEESIGSARPIKLQEFRVTK